MTLRTPNMVFRRTTKSGASWPKVRGLWELTLRIPMVVFRIAVRSGASRPKVMGFWGLTLRTPTMVFRKVVGNGGLNIVIPKVKFAAKALLESGG